MIKTVRWIIFILCSGFLIYKIARIEDFSLFWDSLKNLTIRNFFLLFVAFFLLFANFLTESIKWKILLKNIFLINLVSSIKAVVWGQAGAFVTPNSIGEFPTRALNIPDGYRLKAVTMGFVGSLAQTVAITVCGLVALLVYVLGSRIELTSFHYKTVLYAGLSISVLLISTYIFLPNFGNLLQKSRFGKLRQFSDALRFFTVKQSVSVFLLSFLKYLIFSTQYFLILNFFGVKFSLSEALTAMPVFYLFLTYIPLMNIFEVAVRSSVAIFVFGYFTQDIAAIIAASTLFWLMNFCLPTFIALFLVKK
ncbi:MAG: flippase-like domain-containing protein [Prevotellaceae bacterium]|jgi:hypothetical protein|nr:flippase-like domain-containing protein [Prevotellaceae bacterium]